MDSGAPSWSKWTRAAVGAGATVVTAMLLLGVLAALVAVGGFDLGRALHAMWNGALGSPYAIFSATLVRATPLILTGLAVALAFRGGVLNIGAEGQFLAGATAASAAALASSGILGRASLPLALVAGTAAGAAWSGIPAWLKYRYNVLEVISTIMMNFIALYAVGYLVRGPMQEPQRIYPQSATLPDEARLPAIATSTRLHWGFVIALVVALVLFLVIRFTAAGFRIRASGMSPRAARSAGQIDIGRTGVRTFVTSGAIAGLAGAVEVTGVTFALYENLSPGYGYTAIAVALLAGLDPLRVVVSGVVFGAMEAGASAMQRDASVPAVLISVIEALIVLALLAAGRMRETIDWRWQRAFRISSDASEPSGEDLVTPLDARPVDPGSR